MTAKSPIPGPYEAVLVPALLEIQQKHGFLKREALEEYSRQADVPLHRLQEVASFFPHFKLTPPPKVVMRICRDMACAMAGSRDILSKLQALHHADAAVEGVSCLGRCDRAPAACVSMPGIEHESYYLGRSEADLQRVLESCLSGTAPEGDRDAGHAGRYADWMVDPYAGRPPDYAGVRAAVLARDASIGHAADSLAATNNWTPRQSDYFRLAAVQQMRVDFDVTPELEEAVKCWETETGWAKGRDLGGWQEALLAELDEATLRGMGGAGIPAVQKWRDVRDAVRKARLAGKDDRAFIVVNGDESEPATFKDRELLLRTPHLIVEGVIIAGLITEATQGFIFIRHEYQEQIEACREEIRRAEQLGVCGAQAPALGRPFPVSVFVSPGGYICGEQSALIEAMSDHRGEPRNLPPKLETNGLQDLPTLVSNVETYAWAPFICLKGGKTYASCGVNGWRGRRFFSVSGDVNRPGVYEVPMGLTLRELIEGEQYCQGITGNRKLKAIAPSGPSGGFLPARLTAGAGLPKRYAEKKSWKPLAARRGFDPNTDTLDIMDMELELDLFRELSPSQALGAGLVVYAEDRDIAEQAVYSMEFFRNESCGKCVPCRLGSQKFASLGAHLMSGAISAPEWTDTILPLMGELGSAIALASICGLGRSVPQPLATLTSLFEDDVKAHLKNPPASPGKGKA